MSDITEIGHFVGGRTVAGTSGNTSPVYNPATGQQTGAVALASVEELDAAVAVMGLQPHWGMGEWFTTGKTGAQIDRSTGQQAADIGLDGVG